MAYVHQSIKVLVYCILGVHVNAWSSIQDDGGHAKEAQTKLLVLLENTIRQPNLAKSVQRYHLAADEAKVRLNLAVFRGMAYACKNVVKQRERSRLQQLAQPRNAAYEARD